MNPFEATVRKRGTIAIVDLRGQIDAEADAPLAAARAEADALNPTAVLLRFEDVTYVNSTGIALIVGLLADARKAGRTVFSSGLSEHYKHIFAITRLADFMTFCSDEDAAVSEAGA